MKREDYLRTNTLTHTFSLPLSIYLPISLSLLSFANPLFDTHLHTHMHTHHARIHTQKTALKPRRTRQIEFIFTSLSPSFSLTCFGSFCMVSMKNGNSGGLFFFLLFYVYVCCTSKKTKLLSQLHSIPSSIFQRKMERNGFPKKKLISFFYGSLSRKNCIL